MNSVLIEQFAALFAGRTDAYGADEGGCVRSPVDRYTYEGHLTGGPPVGIYPLVDAKVKWGCTDIDMPKHGGDPDDPTQALNLYRVLRHLGLHPWVERSRSKGFHVWLFMPEWVPAETMRHALLVAHQVADVPPDEVNPKQVGGVELGNYVRLPYPRALLGFPVPPPKDVRQVMVDAERGAGHPINLVDFVLTATELPSDPAVLAKVAALYKPPPKPKPVRATVLPPARRDDVVSRLGGLAFTIYERGPTERFGYDRSRTLQRLAHLCREDGLTASEALTILFDADARWGKHADRGDAEKYVPGYVSRAYGG